MIVSLVNALGKYTLSFLNNLGSFILFLYQALIIAFSEKVSLSKVIDQMEQIGVGSFAIAILTGTFAGAVLALQTYIGFKRYGGLEFIGPLIALSMTRELGPVITGLMVTGRAGSAIAAELGSMRITEQIDALKTLRINPYRYLVIPRILAATIILPFLTVFSMVCGTIGGYIIAVHVLDLNGQQYLEGIRQYVELWDIASGLIKSSFFGFILSWVGTFKGFYAQGGARGVGIATTESVVMGSVLLLIANYFLTAALF